MKEYDSFENVRDALRCLNEYFTHPFDKYIYLVIDKQEGEAAITDDPSDVVKQWIVDYEYNLSCLEDIEVYEYRKVEDDSDWLERFNNWKRSCIKGYIRTKSKVSAEFELTVSVF